MTQPPSALGGLRQNGYHSHWLELFQSALALSGAIHIEDAHGGLFDTAGFSSDDAVDRILIMASIRSAEEVPVVVAIYICLPFTGVTIIPTVETPMGKG